MKFLCVPCDQPMKIESVTPPDRGSVAVRYACPACGYEMAMLTNPLETQLVSSLGIRVGPEAKASDGASKCPFSGMIAAAEQPAASESGVRWTAEASARMQAVPEFVRSMAVSGIEKFAREAGHDEITPEILEEARARFGM